MVFPRAMQAEAFLFATLLQAAPSGVLAEDPFLARFAPMAAFNVSVSLAGRAGGLPGQ